MGPCRCSSGPPWREPPCRPAPVGAHALPPSRPPVLQRQAFLISIWPEMHHLFATEDPILGGGILGGALGLAPVPAAPPRPARGSGRRSSGLVLPATVLGCPLRQGGHAAAVAALFKALKVRRARGRAGRRAGERASSRGGACACVCLCLCPGLLRDAQRVPYAMIRVAGHAGSGCVTILRVRFRRVAPVLVCR